MKTLGRTLAAGLCLLILAGCNARMPDFSAATAALPAAFGGNSQQTPAESEVATAAATNAAGEALAADAATATGAATNANTADTAAVASLAAPTALAPVAQPTVPFFSPSVGPAVRRAHSAIVVDARNGRVIHDEDADGPRYPASLTKMMTLYLLFEAVEQGRFTLASELTASEEAASRPPAKLGLKPGDTITVDQAIRAMSVRSSNDVAVVVAEAVSGSEGNFVNRMNRTARSLGMRRTRFANASGLPNDRQLSSARDMAILSRALLTRHRRFAGYFSLREWTFKGRRIRATNKLLGTVPGVRGIKTGYIRNSGFNLAVSVQRGGRHLIVVVYGGRTGRARDATVTDLIERYMPQASGAPALAGINSGR